MQGKCRVPGRDHHTLGNTLLARFALHVRLTKPAAMLKESAKKRRYPRISLPKGMWVSWYGGGDHQASRVHFHPQQLKRSAHR
jgi:hypothetical protein